MWATSKWRMANWSPRRNNLSPRWGFSKFLLTTHGSRRVLRSFAAVAAVIGRCRSIVSSAGHSLDSLIGGGQLASRLHIFWCRISSKKSLVFTQNIENKRPEISLPPRSMVLKVVRDKILETLELRRVPAAAVPLSNREGTEAKSRSGRSTWVLARGGLRP
jgi:hypothetical protein